VRHIALEVPLRALALRRRGERRHATESRTDRLGDALDRASFARRVASLEERNHTQAAIFDPGRELYKLTLKAQELRFVFAFLERFFLLLLQFHCGWLCDRFAVGRGGGCGVTIALALHVSLHSSVGRRATRA